MLKNFRIWIYSRMALNFMTAGKPEKAETWYKRLESVEPDSIAVLHNLGVIYISLKKFDKAGHYLLREIELYGDTDIRYRILGDLYYNSGQRENAAAAYGKALALSQENNGNKTTERFLRKRIKQCRELSLYAKAVDGARYYEEGIALYTQGDYNNAFLLYEKAIKCDDTSFMALNAAGTVLMNSIKDYENARIFFMRALELADIPLIQGNLELAEYKIREKRGER